MRNVSSALDIAAAFNRVPPWCRAPRTIAQTRHLTRTRASLHGSRAGLLGPPSINSDHDHLPPSQKHFPIFILGKIRPKPSRLVSFLLSQHP